MTRNRHNRKYLKLANWLRSHGYFIKREESTPHSYHFGGRSFDVGGYSSWYITGKNIQGCFCTPNNSSYRCINGYIAIEHKDLFDKWSKCPIYLRVSTLDYNVLESQLGLIGSQAGFELSNKFEGEDVFVDEYEEDKNVNQK